MEMDTASGCPLTISPHAPIDALGISIRASNALKRRRDVSTVADLIRLVEAGELPEIRNICISQGHREIVIWVNSRHYCTRHYRE
jgi:hypothetical protein